MMPPMPVQPQLETKQQRRARIRNTYLVREMLLPAPPVPPCSPEEIERFKSARPRPLNKNKPRGRRVEARCVDDVRAALRKKYETGAFKIRSMNAGPAGDRDQARAVVIVLLQPRKRRA